MMDRAEEWQLQEAKNRFSEVVRQAQRAPQTVTLHGKPSVVIVSFDEYLSLTRPKKSLLEVMRSAPEGFEDLCLERSADSKLRDIAL
ncbi:MAG: type II toxin-antitoxin system Phd/YefM family antitoxin [Coriobacteriales bacterium]|jgi:prevent-host-death family protein|nr:type II toxin-antitoxin system Phd/YefM family antitoxin [Coriobacteriales bacterium]